MLCCIHKTSFASNALLTLRCVAMDDSAKLLGPTSMGPGLFSPDDALTFNVAFAQFKLQWGRAYSARMTRVRILAVALVAGASMGPGLFSPDDSAAASCLIFIFG